MKQTSPRDLLSALLALVLALGVGSASAADTPSSTSDAAGASAAGAPDQSPASLSAAPLFDEPDIYGRQRVALRALRGKVVVLNFWATWCPPCRGEMPALKAIQDEYRGRLTVVGVSVYSTYAATEQFMKDLAITYPTFYGSYELMEQYGEVGSIPTTFLINRNGEIVQRVVGSRSKDQYEALIRPLLDQ